MEKACFASDLSTCQNSPGVEDSNPPFRRWFGLAPSTSAQRDRVDTNTARLRARAGLYRLGVAVSRQQNICEVNSSDRLLNAVSPVPNFQPIKGRLGSVLQLQVAITPTAS